MNKQDKIVQLRKSKGLTDLLRKANGTTPQLYHSSSRDRREEGTPQGEYRGQQLLDTKQFLSPKWDITKSKFAWGGTEQQLAEIVEELKLEYEEGHPNYGQIIKPQDVKIGNFKDPFFRHSTFKNRYYLEEGRSSLNLEDPIQRFLWLCYLGDPSVHNKSQGRISKYKMAGMKMEAVMPKYEHMDQAQKAEKKVRAMELLAQMKENEDRMHAIASAMGIPSYHPDVDRNKLFVILMEEGALQESETSKRYGGKTGQSRFIELAEMDDADINVLSMVMQGIRKALIRRTSDGYLFQGDTLKGLQNEFQLGKYFLEPENQAALITLRDALADLKT